MAIARVQKKAGTKIGGLGTTIAITLDATPIAGNMLLMGIFTNRTTGTSGVSSIAQTNVTWTKVYSLEHISWDGEGTYQFGTLDLWVGVVAASPGATATVTLVAGSLSACAEVFEYSGQHATPLDKISASTVAPGLHPTTGVTAATAEADELAIGFSAVDAAGSTNVCVDNGGQATQITDTSISTNVMKLISYEGLAEAVGTKEGKSLMLPVPSLYGTSGIIATYKQAAAAALANGYKQLNVGIGISI